MQLQENSHFPFKIQVGLSQPTRNLPTFSNPGLAFFLPEGSDWTIHAPIRRLRGRCQASSSAPEPTLPSPDQPRYSGDWWAVKGKAPDVRWGFNMAAAVAAVAAPES